MASWMMCWECRRETLAEDINMGISSLEMYLKPWDRVRSSEECITEGKRLRDEP